jgi:ABC-2 type transport system ATP-binding protein
MTVLTFDSVGRGFLGREVLRDLTFQQQAGEVVGLLGRNGAGKSTLVHLALGMLRPESGRVRVFGLDPRKNGVAVKRRIGFVSEHHTLAPMRRVKQVLEFHRSLFPTWDEALERQLLDRFEIPLGSRPAQLSKGQARQVGLLCAIAHRPELLILDEPAAGLDPVVRREFLEASIELLGEGGSAILFSSHQMSDVERLSSRILLLKDRSLFLDVNLDEFREGYCVAVLERTNGEVAQLRKMPSCLQARDRARALHAVFRGAPQQVEADLHRQGFVSARCRHAGLEDLFIELTGGES